jgi:Uma2 family endonuclease
MAVHPTTKSIPTDEELMALPKDGYKRELLDGEIVMTPAGSEHGRQIMRFSYALAGYVYSHNIGELFDGQTGFRMSSGDLLCPGVSFVGTARLPQGRHEGFFEGGPDLAIEFLSPSESKKHVDRKINLYFANQTRMVWLVDIRRRTVAVWRDAKSSRTLAEHDTLTGDDLLPGFSIPVQSFFAGIPH